MTSIVKIVPQGSPPKKRKVDGGSRAEGGSAQHSSICRVKVEGDPPAVADLNRAIKEIRQILPPPTFVPLPLFPSACPTSVQP
jgi:hypothetical protein